MPAGGICGNSPSLTSSCLFRKREQQQPVACLVRNQCQVGGLLNRQTERRLAANCQRGTEIRTPWGRLRNDLEPAVLPKYLFVGLLKSWLKEQPETLFALMSGSGSTVFAIVASETDGETLRGRLGTEFGKQTWSAVCPLNPGSDPIS